MKIPNMGNMQQLMKQAQKMQKEAAKLQEELKATEFVGVASGEALKVSITGDYSVKSVEISADAKDADVEVLQDMVQCAFQDAISQIKSKEESSLKGIPKGLF